MTKNRKNACNSGYNLRPTEIQAAIGLAQMSKINKFLKKRKKIFNVYNKLLKKNEIINFLPSNAWSENSYWYYTIFIKGVEKNRKEILMKRLKKFGIETRPGFYPLHSMKPYIKYAKYNYKVSDYFSKNSISLPTFYLLKEAEQIYIVKTLLKALDNLI